MRFLIVDVFAENKYEGNQLAVLIPDFELQQEEMLKIAREINFSETTFIVSGKQDNGGYNVRIFMPDSEIPFGGHPTLGTAYVIRRFLEEGNSSQIDLNLQIGQIPVSFDDDDYAWMAQAHPSFGIKIDSEQICKILQIEKDMLDERYPIQNVSTGLPSIIVPLKTLEAVKKCKINHSAYGALLNKVGNTNILVFAPETESAENDLHVRVFMFSAGYLEDPATGSANGNLAGYLLKNNYFNSNDITYRVEQGYSIGRKSLIKVNASMNHDHYSINVGGKVYVVADGQWY